MLVFLMESKCPTPDCLGNKIFMKIYSEMRYALFCVSWMLKQMHSILYKKHPKSKFHKHRRVKNVMGLIFTVAKIFLLHPRRKMK